MPMMSLQMRWAHCNGADTDHRRRHVHVEWPSLTTDRAAHRVAASSDTFPAKMLEHSQYLDAALSMELVPNTWADA
jgi:hypothetical protein